MMTSREVVQVHLDRIAAINPTINAIVTLLAEEALVGADDADKAVRGRFSPRTVSWCSVHN